MQEITNLWQQDGKDIAVHGSATLVQTLMHHNLVGVMGQERNREMLTLQTCVPRPLRTAS